MEKVYIITATVGTELLIKCVESVQKQDYVNIEHILVYDGINNMKEQLYDYDNLTKLILPWNTGRDKFICHKIYAAIPHLLHSPGYVMFLDEDNTIDSNHVSSLVHTIREHECTWAYALRKIINHNDEVICKDMCESLGYLSPTWMNEKDFLVDTSCYLIPIHIVRLFSECWQRRARENPEADRLFYHYLSKEFPNFKCSMKYTLNYRIEGRPDSVTGEFFKIGNQKMLEKYNFFIPYE